MKHMRKSKWDLNDNDLILQNTIAVNEQNIWQQIVETTTFFLNLLKKSLNPPQKNWRMTEKVGNEGMKLYHWVIRGMKLPSFPIQKTSTQKSLPSISSLKISSRSKASSKV